MPEYKGTMIFGWGAQGWSESWYAIKPDQGDAFRSFQKVAEQRAKMLGKQSFLQAFKISDLSVRGDAVLEPMASEVEVGSVNQASDAVWLGWYCRFEAGAGSRRQLFLRGQPDAAYSAAAQQSALTVRPEAAFKSAFEKYVSVVKKEKWGLRVIDPNANPLRVVKKIEIINPPARQGIQLTFDNAGDVPVGTELLLYRMASVPLLSHKERVHSTNPPTSSAELFLLGTPLQVQGYSGKGLVRINRTAIVPITDGAILRIGKRDTGRAFFVTAGRQSKGT